MSFEEQIIKGVYVINNFVAKDQRGIFVKTFHEDLFSSIGFTGKFSESYYSQSYKDVIRGMHFQLPPHDHEKLVYVIDGSILDVILDLRKESETYGQYVSIVLNAFEKSVFIPKGCAHGFLTLSKTATVVYNVTTVYNLNSDAGVLWNSFEFNWQVDNPIISSRDKCFLTLHEFKTPFL
jgi:dTDP-4-dehydrorhamnose 3,5-epimerase